MSGRDATDELGRNIPLSEMIESLRKEIEISIANAKDEDIRFRWEQVDLELQVLVEKQKEGGGGLKFWVLNASGKHARKDLSVHTFKISLTPVPSKVVENEDSLERVYSENR